MYERSNAPCPKCGGGTGQDEVHNGVAMLYGPRGCGSCGWSEAEEYDLSDGRNPLDEKGGAIDQYGGYYPAGSDRARVLRAAQKAAPPHGGIKIGDHVTWAGERCRVTGVYDGCDEIVIEQLDEPGGFDVLWCEHVHGEMHGR